MSKNTYINAYASEMKPYNTYRLKSLFSPFPTVSSVSFHTK